MVETAYLSQGANGRMMRRSIAQLRAKMPSIDTTIRDRRRRGFRSSAQDRSSVSMQLVVTLLTSIRGGVPGTDALIGC